MSSLFDERISNSPQNLFLVFEVDWKHRTDHAPRADLECLRKSLGIVERSLLAVLPAKQKEVEKMSIHLNWSASHIPRAHTVRSTNTRTSSVANFLNVSYALTNRPSIVPWSCSNCFNVRYTANKPSIACSQCRYCGLETN